MERALGIVQLLLAFVVALVSAAEETVPSIGSTTTTTLAEASATAAAAKSKSSTEATNTTRPTELPPVFGIEIFTPGIIMSIFVVLILISVLSVALSAMYSLKSSSQTIPQQPPKKKIA
ncbi:hypothetical protein GQ42DRAFT_164300 [Ramicandelaber brevisporus]|nr:hypothetical protein GQ42DRAFT_164366 [Ramicandelaber brevisporus]KAI8868201.1 hypothetical protein GQ42DRAFT_164300 [Ramicandelaber brevisporus]